MLKITPMTHPHIRQWELVQVTPMIHFQPGQKGATLRPTQVKPMLDRFLQKEYRRLHGGDKMPEKWFMSGESGKDKAGLRYKLTITPTGAPMESRERERLLFGLKKFNNDPSIDTAIKSLPKETPELKVPLSYFGNISAGKNMKVEEQIHKILTGTRELILFPQPLRVEIYCEYSELMELIGGCIKDFFLLHSFGTRSSKGFGSFLIKGTTTQYAHELYARHYGSYICAEGIQVGTDTVCNALNYGSAMVQLMKSGINQSSYIDGRARMKKITNQGYRKGYLIRRFQLEGIGSDKRFMKEKVRMAYPRDGQFAKDSPNSRTSSPAPQKGYGFIRALLGLADHIDFRDNMFNDTVKMISVDGSAERFRCPITVRILPEGICFLPEAYPKGYLGKEFLFLNKEEGKFYSRKNAREKKIYMEQNKNRILSIPETFDLKGFLWDFADDYNGETLSMIKGFKGKLFKNITGFHQGSLLKKGGSPE